MTLELSNALTIAGLLFAIGAAGAIARRSLLFILASIEIMFVAAGVAFVAVARSQGDLPGQTVYLFVLAAAAAQVSVGLALIVAVRRRLGGIDADRASSLRG